MISSLEAEGGWEWAAPLLVYAVYLLLHALPYLPFYFKNRKRPA